MLAARHGSPLPRTPHVAQSLQAKGRVMMLAHQPDAKFNALRILRNARTMLMQVGRLAGDILFQVSQPPSVSAHSAQRSTWVQIPNCLCFHQVRGCNGSTPLPRGHWR